LSKPGVKMEPVASVVVPVRDGGPDLIKLLDALSAQTLLRERFEVIIGDDGSTDGAVTGLASTDGWIRVSSGPPRNSYVARNRAACESRGSVLAFCDADCRPDPDWLEAGLEALESADVVAGLIRFTVPELPSIPALLEIDIFFDQERSVRSGRAVTANLFARREWFERVGGFDDTLPNTGDYDFVSRCVASGARLVFAPNAIVSHPTRDSARSLFRKIWAVNRRYAAREGRHGRKPHGLELRSWVPLVQPLRARGRFGRSIRPDRKRLAESGLTPRLWDDLRALPLMYIAIPYFAGFAEVVGWWEARRARTAA
jgi:GT2 family glycosyltransferase